MIAYVHDGIWTVKADGTGQIRLTGEQDDGSPHWSPDGTRIVFHRLRQGSNRIWVMDADGSDQIELADGSYPAWSPDGRQIVYSSLRDRSLHLVDPRGMRDARLTRPGRGTLDLQPDWSPDGSRILFVRYLEDTGFPGDIAIVEADGDGFMQVTTNWFRDEFDPAWAPDGSLIVFSGTPKPIAGEFAILTMDLTGDNKRVVVGPSGARNYLEPSWQPIP
jgi:TolB protein